MEHVRFLPKAVTVCFRKKEGFHCKNNHKCNKSGNFWLGKIGKINYKMLIALSYISLRLKLNKV